MFKTILLGIITGITLGFGILFLNSSPEKSTISYKTIQDINPDLIIDKYALSSPEMATYLLQGFSKKIQEKEFFITTPMGLLVKRGEKKLNIIIESGGGVVQVADIFKETINQLRSVGIHVNCYIKSAMSAAFYLAVTSCDSRIALEGVQMMQHRSYYGKGTYTAGTANLDLRMAKIEARYLNVDFQEWLEYTRTWEDKYFTRKEMERLKLIHRNFDYGRGK